MTTQRTVPMQVLCLGMCRTGTQSLADALALLGITPVYHMREAHKNQHQKNWLPLLEKKFASPSQHISATEFENVLGNFGAVTDIPAAIFATDLMDAYPDARVVLTTRDEDRWLESMKATLWHAKTSSFGEVMFRFLWGDDREGEGKMRFRQHNKMVLAAAKERGKEVLIYEVKEGWGPLCEFLGIEKVPEGDFPRSDDWAEYKKETQGIVAGK